MNILLEAHSGWRYLVILVFIVAIVRALWGWLGKGEWGAWDNRLGMTLPIVVDIQVLLGLVLWIMQQRWMGNNALASWEHPVTMLLTVAVAHITWSRVKKQPTDAGKFRTAAVGFILAGLLLALGVARITHVI